MRRLKGWRRAAPLDALVLTEWPQKLLVGIDEAAIGAKEQAFGVHVTDASGTYIGRKAPRWQETLHDDQLVTRLEIVSVGREPHHPIFDPLLFGGQRWKLGEHFGSKRAKPFEPAIDA